MSLSARGAEVLCAVNSRTRTGSGEWYIKPERQSNAAFQRSLIPLAFMPVPAILILGLLGIVGRR